MRRPPGVTRTIRRAIYHQFFDALNQAERDTEMLDAVEALPADYRTIGRGPAARHADELVLQVLLALNSGSPSASEVAENLATNADDLRQGLRSRLQRLIAVAIRKKQPTPQTVDPEAAAFENYAAGDSRGALQAVIKLPLTVKTFHVAVLAAADLEDDDAARLALDYIDREPELRAQLAHRRQIHRALAELEQRRGTVGPSTWGAWLDLIASGATATEASAATPNDYAQWSPMTFEEMSSRVGALSDDALIVLGEVSGQFVVAHRDVIEGAGPAGAVLGRRLLEALAVGMKASAGIQAQTLNLVEVAFLSSFSPQEYSDILQYIGEIRKTNSAPGTADWQTDLMQVVTSYPDADVNSGALTNFVASCLNDLIPFRYALARTSISAIELVCMEHDIDLPNIFLTTTEDVEDEIRQYSYLAGKTVALYSLMESASSRAAQLLRKLVPSVEISLFKDKVGNTILAQASETADLFVIVTAAAKHAATEFIEAHRGSRKLIRVNSKGTSAIMRALRNPG